MNKKVMMVLLGAVCVFETAKGMDDEVALNYAPLPSEVKISDEVIANKVREIMGRDDTEENRINVLIQYCKDYGVLQEKTELVRHGETIISNTTLIALFNRVKFIRTAYDVATGISILANIGFLLAVPFAGRDLAVTAAATNLFLLLVKAGVSGYSRFKEGKMVEAGAIAYPAQ